MTIRSRNSNLTLATRCVSFIDRQHTKKLRWFQRDGNKDKMRGITIYLLFLFNPTELAYGRILPRRLANKRCGTSVGWRHVSVCFTTTIAGPSPSLQPDLKHGKKSELSPQCWAISQMNFIALFSLTIWNSFQGR